MYKLILTVPEKNADELREAMANAGAGKIGNYTNCSFSTKGIGRSKPNKDADPHIGETGKLTEIEEEKIETTVCEGDLKAVIEAIKRVHPYEEPVIDVYSLYNPIENEK